MKLGISKVEELEPLIASKMEAALVISANLI